LDQRRRLKWEKAASSTARELMSVALVSISPDATVAEAARRMHTAEVKRLPVIAEGGRLVGIVSRSDLLKVFNRPDEAIRRRILDEVIVGEFMMGPDRFFIRVQDGVVVPEGRVERHSILPLLVRAVRGVEGVVQGRAPIGVGRRRPRRRLGDGFPLDASLTAGSSGLAWLGCVRLVRTRVPGR
jgi:hypothetical protein